MKNQNIANIINEFLADNRSVEYSRIGDSAYVIKTDYYGGYRIECNGYCIAKVCTINEAKSIIENRKREHAANVMDNNIAKKRERLERQGISAYYSTCDSMDSIMSAYNDYKESMYY